MPGMSVTLRSGSLQDIDDALRIAFHGSGAVAIAANAEPVFGGDLHQIGGLPEQARDFLVLQTGFLHPIVSSRIGPFGVCGASLQYAAICGVALLLSVAFLTLYAEPGAVAQSATITVVNSASYGNFIAPDSIATIFGANLSFGTATAVLNDDRQLPTVLGQTRVEINGVAAALYFVSPGQINLLVPAGLTTGTATVVVRSTATGATQNGTAQIQPAAPGIFASDGSGSGPGAILNAINFRPAPFLVLTDSEVPRCVRCSLCSAQVCATPSW